MIFVAWTIFAPLCTRMSPGRCARWWLPPFILKFVPEWRKSIALADIELSAFTFLVPPQGSSTDMFIPLQPSHIHVADCTHFYAATGLVEEQGPAREE